MEHGFSLHRAIRHVPLLVRLPGSFDAGRAVDSVVRLEDVMPTVLELCGVRAPSGLDGASLVGDVTGRVSRASQGENAEAKTRYEKMFPGVDVTHLAAGARAVYDGKFHWIASTDGREELYDVARDPDERENLAAGAPDVAAKMRALDAAGK
jgi:arylsulfatase A-like enzyme